MSVFGKMTADRFLEEYWQIQPVLAPGALSYADGLVPLDFFYDAVASEELASTLLLRPEGRQWDVLLGPFEEPQIQALTEPFNLTLRGIDKFLPELKDFIDRFRFLPDWQKEEPALSYSATNAYRGPYVNETDSFFVNLGGDLVFEYDSGDVEPEFFSYLPIAVVENFEVANRLVVRSGDLVYLPAGYCYRHTGSLVLVLACHSPRRSELMADWLAVCQRDPRLKPWPEEGDGVEITSETVDRFRELLSGAMEEPDFALWCARYVTSGTGPPVESMHEPVDLPQFISMLDECPELERSEQVRWGYFQAGDQPMLLVDGFPYPAPLEVVKTVATESILDSTQFDGQEALLCELYNRGYLDFADFED